MKRGANTEALTAACACRIGGGAVRTRSAVKPSCRRRIRPRRAAHAAVTARLRLGEARAAGRRSVVLPPLSMMISMPALGTAAYTGTENLSSLVRCERGYRCNPLLPAMALHAQCVYG